MKLSWILLAACISCCVNCDNFTPTSEDETEVEPGLRPLFDFKPCLGEDCNYYRPLSVSQRSHRYLEEPEIYCIYLSPNSARTINEIENANPDMYEVKSQVLDDLLSHMKDFAKVAATDCNGAMKLVDLIIAAADSLRTQYLLEGDSECVYQNIEDRIGKMAEPPCPLAPGGSKGSTPCPERVSSTVTPCPEGTTTEKPCVPTTEKPTQEPCPEGTTTEKPCVPTTEKPTQEPCIDGTTTEKPCIPTTEKPTQEPCPDGTTTEKPCLPNEPTEDPYKSTTEEILAEDEYLDSHFVGSIRAIPGIHYPDYTEIPITSFSCADKKYIPGFYADLETGCQVFHMCYEHRRESFLCPVGTIFNQPILACDYWYSSNCSLAPMHYDVNDKTCLQEDKIDAEVEEIVSIIIESEAGEQDTKLKEKDLDTIAQFLPVEVKVIDVKPQEPVVEKTTDVDEVASDIFDAIVSTATKAVTGTRSVIAKIPEPVEWEVKPVFKPIPKLVTKQVKLTAAVPAAKITAFGKAKVAAAIPAVKLAATAKVAAPIVTKMAAAVPVTKMAMKAIPISKVKLAAPAVKAKVAAPMVTKMAAAKAVPVSKVKLAVPVAKTKMAAVVPKAVAKTLIPALKAKTAAAALPLVKLVAPALKGAILKGAAIPLKAKTLAVPLAKSKLAGPIPLAKLKLAKAAAISPLTTKALAAGYMKLLKAKKLALMG